MYKKMLEMYRMWNEKADDTECAKQSPLKIIYLYVFVYCLSIYIKRIWKILIKAFFYQGFCWMVGFFSSLSLSHTQTHILDRYPNFSKCNCCVVFLFNKHNSDCSSLSPVLCLYTVGT